MVMAAAPTLPTRAIPRTPAANRCQYSADPLLTM